MNLPHAAHIHYRCVFDLKEAEGAQATWVDIPKAIRSWIADRVPTNEAYGRGWFFTGGQWKPSGIPRTVIATRQVVGTGDARAPQFWSVRFEHACLEFPHTRQWRTDIGVSTQANGHYRVSLATMHWLLPGFVGEEPTPPIPTAPGIITALVGSRFWSAFAGSELLTTAPRLLLVGEGKDLRARLSDPTRLCPIVLLAGEFPTGSISVDASRLAWLTAGTAKIVVAESSEVDKELEWLLPSEYRCWNGMIRIYQPGLDLSRALDGKRHRFFKRDQILQLGTKAVEDMIIRGIARRSQLHDLNDPVSLEDLDTKDRELRLIHLKAAGGESAEWASELEADNVTLNALVRDTRDALDKVKAALAEADDRTEELQLETRTVSSERDYFKAQAFEAQARVRQCDEQLGRFRSLERLPSTLPEVIALIEGLYSGRLAFTDSARASAERAAFNKCTSDMPEAWRMLWHMATTLYELHFTVDLDGRLDKLFRERSGIDLALTEGSQTKADSRLVAMRQDTYLEEEIDISPHLKFGDDPPKCLRIHYHAHPTRRLLIIGHCGDHLTTAGTRRRR